MTIELPPELEEIVRQDMQAGIYGSMEEYLERAVMLLHNQENWLTRHRDELSAQIEEGWQDAERGDVIDAEQLKAELRLRKRT
jgi:putative addiction module CopG family antidote